MAPTTTISPRTRGALRRFSLLAWSLALGVLLWRTRVFGLASSSAWLVGVRDRMLDPGVVSLGLMLLALLCLYLASRAIQARATFVCLVLGYIGTLGLYWGNATMSDGSLLTPFERFEYAHGEFSQLAFTQRGHLFDTLHDYEQLVVERRLGVYAPSKPPGIFLVYGGLDFVAQSEWFNHAARDLIELARTRDRIRGYEVPVVAAMVVFPLLYACVFPLLYAVVRALRGSREQAFFAAAIWATCPAPLIFNFNADNAVYPGLALLATALFLEGVRRDRAVWVVLAGFVFGLALYITFSLLPLLPVFGLLALMLRRSAWTANQSARVVGWCALFGLAVLASQVLFVWGLHYEPWLRFPRAMAYHRQWKVDCIGGLLCGGTGLGEFAAFVAPPLVVSVFITAGLAMRRATRSYAMLPTALVFLIFALAWTNGTNEVGRIWGFLVPYLALTVGLAAPTLSAGLVPGGEPMRGRSWVLAVVVAQLLLLPVIRASESW